MDMAINCNTFQIEMCSYCTLNGDLQQTSIIVAMFIDGKVRHQGTTQREHAWFMGLLQEGFLSRVIREDRFIPCYFGVSVLSNEWWRGHTLVYSGWLHV